MKVHKVLINTTGLADTHVLDDTLHCIYSL
jgi:hypothetical protein